MNRDRVLAHLRRVEKLTDPPPLLSLVILANGAGLMVAHPMFKQDDPEQREAAVRLVRAQLREVSAHFELVAEQLIQAGVPR